MAQLKSTNIMGNLTVTGKISTALNNPNHILMSDGGTKFITGTNIVSIDASGGDKQYKIPIFDGDAGGAELGYSTASIQDGVITATGFNAASDKRLKSNIIPYQPDRSILDLPVYKYDYIDGPKNQIGCLAQDLQTICPEIVQENGNGYLSIQESKIVYLLIEEVRRLKEEIKQLKEK